MLCNLHSGFCFITISTYVFNIQLLYIYQTLDFSTIDYLICMIGRRADISIKNAET